MLVLFHLHGRNVVVEFVPREVATKVVPNQDRLGDLSCREAYSTHHIPPTPLTTSVVPPSLSPIPPLIMIGPTNLGLSRQTQQHFVTIRRLLPFHQSRDQSMHACPCHSLSLSKNIET